MDQAHQCIMRMHLAAQSSPNAVSKILAYAARKAGLAEDFFASTEFESHRLGSIDFERLLQLDEDILVRQVGLLPKTARAYSEALQDSFLFNQECALLDKHAHSIKYVTLLDDEYPLLLRTIYCPPPIIYMQGEQLAPHAKRLAVVGARAADDYAQAVLAAILPEMINYGWHIVSGGALGADAFAHEITVQAGGQTIVVLGSGLLSWYPQQNFALFERAIKSGGTILSSFPLNTGPERHNFPARNRIIAGLSQGCVVVQAARKSGALITAQFALEQGRQIFAVPGSLFSPLSEGTHSLLNQGAGIVISARSLLEAFNEVPPAQQEQQQSLALFDTAKKTTMQQKVVMPYSMPKVKKELAHPVLVHFQGAMSLDELVAKSAQSAHELHDLLFTLQLEGAVKQNFAGLWELV